MKTASQEFREQLGELLPQMRAFARSLCRDATRADDLVHDAILKGWDNLNQFQAGTNLRAWLFTILRNQHYSELRKRQREVEDVDGAHAERLTTPPSQMDHVRLVEFRDAFVALNSQQREALFLVGACGFTTTESAAICGCAEGTIKSRVNRARVRLAELLSLNDGENMHADSVMTAAASHHPLLR